MSIDPSTLRAIRQRWRSAKHVGEAKPAMRAYVRQVKLSRRAERVSADDVYSTVPGWETAQTIWRGHWKAYSGWKKLPNVLAVDTNQDYANNGVDSFTVEIDNVGMISTEGVAGFYRAIKKGYYSPFYGWKPQGRPAAGSATNSWFDTLNDKSTQIIVIAGYGDVAIPIAEGLVNDCDLSSRPHKIILTCRDGGQTLTDQRVFLNAKIKKVKDPITFADRGDAENKERRGGGARSSGNTAGFPERFVTDDKDNTFWKSKGYQTSTPGDLPFIEVSLPAGRYDSIVLHPRYRDMEAYVAIQARDAKAPGGKGAKKVANGERLRDGEWVHDGPDQVPYTSIPTVKHIKNAKAREVTYKLPGAYILGDGSKVRVYFTNLPKGPLNHSHKRREFRAGVVLLQAVHKTTKKEAKKGRWILVDDLSDVVRTVFQWCGLNDWEVETTGVSLRDKAVFARGSYLIDIIKMAAEQVGYVFHMKPREFFDEDPGVLAEHTDEMSLGIAVFRQTNAMRFGGEVRDHVEMIHEDKTLTGLSVKLTDEPLASHIRVRGKAVGKKKGGRRLGADQTRRYMYVYRPPWARSEHPGGNWPKNSASQEHRNGNIKKYVVYHSARLRSTEECEVAALLIAFREALAAAQGSLSAPAMPSIFLDAHCSVYDTGTGLSTRMWVASRSLSYRSGENGHFTMSLSGSLLDLPDTQRVRKELKKSLRKARFDPGLSDYELEHAGDTYRNNGNNAGKKAVGV